MDVELGKKVISSDGKQVGKVDSIVMDYNTREMQSIICRSGMLLTVDRIIPLDAVAQLDEDGNVILSLTADDAEKQQRFVQREFRAATPDEMEPMPVTWATGTGQAPFYFYPATDALGYRDDTPFFSNAPLAPPDVEVESNLPENATRLGTGTSVVSSDGHKLGTVEDVEYNPEGDLTGFIVKAGFLFHHDVDVPASWIESVTSDEVKLRVTADQANETHDTA